MLIRGGTVWGEDGARREDVRVAGETVAEVGTLAPLAGEEVVDARGLHLVPGMCDFHVHADDRIAGCELADTFATVSAVALANGITTVAGFVTQAPGEALGGALARCLARAAGASGCDFTFHLTPTAWPWDRAEIAELVARGFSTFKLYTTYRDAGLFTDYPRLGEAMAVLAPLGGCLLVHCEDDATLAGADSGGGDPADAGGHALARPEVAETTAIARVLELALATGCRTHVVHVSTAAGAASVAAARERVRVTCETAPHYLLLDRSALGGEAGYRWLCTPPLRDAGTRERLEAAAAAGAFDLLATDHCAFTRADKDGERRDWRRVPKGIAGTGALVPLAHELLVRRHGLPLSELVRRLAANPARLLGAYPRKGAIAPGSDADLVLLDPEGVPRPVVSSLAACHETYPGRTTTLDVRRVWLRGREVVRGNRLLAGRAAGGRCLAAA